MGLLGDLFSFGNTTKRKLRNLLDDPVGSYEKMGGLLQDWHKEYQQGLADQLAGKNTPSSHRAYDTTMGIAGLAPVGMFSGVGAKTADLIKQGLAEKMLKSGEDPAKVWRETGWGIGPDGKWRFEIPDNAAEMSRFPKAANQERVGNVLDHEQLWSAYPKAEKIPFQSADMVGERAAYMHGPNPKRFEGSAMSISPGAFSPGNAWRHFSVSAPPEAKSATLHELQHAIQQREGYAKGGAPRLGDFDVKEIRDSVTEFLKPQFDTLWKQGKTKEALRLANADPMQLYKRLAGEAEARLTQSRMNMDAGQRAAQYPWEPNYFQLGSN